MDVLLIAILAGVGFIVAYHTYGRWLGRKVFQLSATAVCPSHRLNDGSDYVPTKTSIVFGHHFTSIAGTGPIVGPAIAVMWGWLPALLWVFFGSILIGAVHDFGSLVVSLRNNGQTVGQIAGRLLNRRVRLLFLFVLFMALTIVLAIFGLVIAAVFRQYPAAIFPCMVQIPIAIGIGLWLHRKGVNLLVPSLLALAVMYLTVIYGDAGWLHTVNQWFAGWPTIVWVVVLLVYSYVASVLPVWTLLQPRDFINSLQLLSALALIVIGLVVAAFMGGAPPVEGAERQPLEIVAPMVNWSPEGAPALWPFLFITIACGAISGFHCLVSSGTSSKQLEHEPAARCVGYGAMLTEGFLATIVILACVAGLGLGAKLDMKPAWPIGPAPDGSLVFTFGSEFQDVEEKTSLMFMNRFHPEEQNSDERFFWQTTVTSMSGGESSIDDTFRLQENQIVQVGSVFLSLNEERIPTAALTSATAFNSRYTSWAAAGGLAAKVGAFVDGAANFLKAIGIPASVAIALMGVLVASFAGTTLDTACRLQRYVVQELAAALLPQRGPTDCVQCGYDLRGNTSGGCPECGAAIGTKAQRAATVRERATSDTETPSTEAPAATALSRSRLVDGVSLNPIAWLTNKHVATVFAVLIAAALAAMPAPGADWSWATSGTGGLILWPMFGATNQLLGGLAFLVITFYLLRRKKPVWFLAFPLVFMLVMPAWAMLAQLPGWLASDTPNWALIGIAIATLLLEAWMIVEAVLLWPRVKGVLEEPLAGAEPEAGLEPG